MGKIKKDPEQEARWAEERRQLAERVEFLEEKIRQERERADRRRELLRRFSFGLLGGS
jgi:hypothetical protein